MHAPARISCISSSRWSPKRNDRVFHKCLNDLLKLKAERRKAKFDDQLNLQFDRKLAAAENQSLEARQAA
jgi:hypothetical protein